MTFRGHSAGDIRAYPVVGDPLDAPVLPAVMTATATHPAAYTWKIGVADRRYQMVQGKGDRYSVTEHGEFLGNGWFTAIFIHRQWLSLAPVVPLDHQAFMIWLAFRTFIARQTDL